MRVTLLGTGAADGIPQPFCSCATCEDARACGEVRAPGGVLVDATLLIDPGPGVAGAAARAGVDLSRVSTIAVTHGHSDHWDPSILLFRQWIVGGGAELPPLRVIGPPDVVESAAAWVPGDAQVEFLPAAPGDAWELGTLTLRALPSSHGGTRPGAAVDDVAVGAVLWDVRDGLDGSAVLYAADTGMPAADLLTGVADAAYDVALVELTFGAAGPSTPGHLDHATFPRMLAELRRVGAITQDTDVVAIHLGHHNPPSAQLRTALASWGARAVPDGTALVAPGSRGSAHRDTAAPRASITFITGGARSGKSTYAERLAGNAADVVYLATGWPRGALGDEDWDRRVDAHVGRRPSRWRTREWTSLTPADLGAAVMAAPPGSTVLIDCLALWLTRLIDFSGGWDDPSASAAAVDEGYTCLMSALAATQAAHIIVVSNEVGSGVVPATKSGRVFRDHLGRINAGVASASDAAYLVVAGRPVPLGPQVEDSHV